jgi:hypothetical protein
VEYPVDTFKIRLNCFPVGNIYPMQMESRIPFQMSQALGSTRGEVIKDNYRMTII